MPFAIQKSFARFSGIFEAKRKVQQMAEKDAEMQKIAAQNETRWVLQ